MAPNRGGRGRWRSRGGRQPGAGRGPYNASAQAMDTFLAAAMNGYTMRDEARNTARDHLKWNSDERLRYRPVTFVSAGLIDPLKELQVDGNDEKKDAKTQHTVLQDRPQTQDGGAKDERKSTSPSRSAKTDHDALPNKVENVKPSSSGTSKETTSQAMQDDKLFMIDTVGDKTLRKEQKKPAPVQLPDYKDEESVEESDSSDEIIVFRGRAALPKKSEIPSKQVVKDSPQEIELLAKKQSERLQIKAASRQVVVQATKVSSKKQVWYKPDLESLPFNQGIANKTPDADEDEEDEDEDAILADYMANMDGLEDLVAQHVKFASRDIGGSDNDIVVGAGSDSDDSADSDDGDDELGDEDDRTPHSASEEDVPAEIDDAELARLLAKQEELGLAGDELLLFDGAVSGRDRSRQPRWYKASSTPKQERKTNQPDSAQAVAEAFDDLDLLDWEHANSLRRKPKGKHGTVKLTNEDAELQAIMDATYEKDRLKKKERKREREELRAKGLLGKNANPDDPRVKYAEGINLVELREEFETFLLSLDQILTLPPMDSSARKIVHEIASKLRIKSKSTGKGDQRRPVLSRTKITVLYSEEVLDKAFSRVNRRYFPRLDKQSFKPGRGGGGGHGSTRYRDGEVVGASAPELGESNKGRAMLEKMGWSKGMGLGAVDNKGILEPVAHVVKTSKAGLG